MKRHAYLIMAHDNFYCLEKLLSLLDDARNTIFLHIDAKVKGFDFDFYRKLCKNAQLIYPKKRIHVQWGTQSQVKTEMLLLKTAAANGPFHYYHILSGSDLPLRSQDAIHTWFADKTSSYLYYSEQATLWDIQRVARFHFFVKTNRITARLDRLSAAIQERLHVDRIQKSALTIYKGSNWASLTQQAVDTLLHNEKQILRFTKFSVCADEVYKQTILMHNNIPIIRNDLRLILWKDDLHPHTFRTEDYELLCSSDRFFARKFSESIDRQIIDRIEHKVRSETQCAAK